MVTLAINTTHDVMMPSASLRRTYTEDNPPGPNFNGRLLYDKEVTNSKCYEWECSRGGGSNARLSVSLQQHTAADFPAE